MHYHLIGIAGTAMGSLAGLLRARGHRVTGSDQGVYPPMSTLLDELGIPFTAGFSPSNLEPAPDLVVVGNAISRGNPELEAVLDRRLPYDSAARVVRDEFLRGRHVLAVAGTHGKTTTSALLAWLLECAGMDPSFLIGGVTRDFGTSFRLTESDWFVIEADEYDTAFFDKGPKMWHYLPRTAVLTNVEFDHADIYRDEIAYRFAFERFVNLIPGTGTLVAGWDSPLAREVSAGSLAPVESFALTPSPLHPRWFAGSVEQGAERMAFDVHRGTERLGRVETALSGEFNVRNALAAIAAATAVGAEWEGIRRGLETFRGVGRRLEVRGDVGGVTVLDDFAHHPTAVRETILAVRARFPGRRIVAILEPRSYTAQRRESQEPFRSALETADRVIVAGLFRPERYAEGRGLDPEELVASLRASDVSADHIPSVDRIVETLAEGSRPGDVLLVMSNGGFEGIHGKLLDALAASTPREPG